MKNLIIYYSRKGENYVDGGLKTLEKGNTQICAEYIQKAAEADVFQIETVKEYPADYYTCIDEAKKEQSKKARPELKKYLTSLEEYDNIFICGPCWWGTYPMAVFSQLEKLDWKGKKVLPLMTHEGSGLGSCEKDLKKICKGAAFGKGLAVQGARVMESEKAVKAWAISQI